MASCLMRFYHHGQGNLLEGLQQALLTALASYQIDEQVIEAFRAYYATDAQLVGAVAWASGAAARRISSWLEVPMEHRPLSDPDGVPRHSGTI